MNLVDRHRSELLKLTKRLDSSFYFYDLDHLDERLKSWAEELDPAIKLWFACKANPLSSILKVFRNNGFGLDVAAKGELDQALASGVRPHEILSTGPSKSKKYLRTLLENEINVIVVESHYQLGWLSDLALELGIKPDVLLRVQLPWEEGKSVLGGGDITAFGLDSEGWLKADHKLFQNLNVMGLHCFQWGNILEIDRLEAIWRETLSGLMKLGDALPIDLKVIDLGGGLGIPYQNETRELNFSEVHHVLKELRKEFNVPEIWMELGRFAIGPSGLYLSQVIDRKNVRGKEFLVLDGGINHLARPALTGQAFPAQILRSEATDKNCKFQVNGPLCTALDSLGCFELPADTDYGDWLIFSQTGAYGFTEAMPFFLCHNLPAEVTAYRGDIMIPRTIKTSSDWLV